jgi:hypothetical protein
MRIAGVSPAHKSLDCRISPVRPIGTVLGIGIGILALSGIDLFRMLIPIPTPNLVEIPGASTEESFDILLFQLLYPGAKAFCNISNYRCPISRRRLAKKAH